ncbi:MAG: universal stress protein [Bacteroidales bacterium]
MRPIIVPIDFSEGSANALEHAISIARKGGIDLRLIWVRKPEDMTPVFSDGKTDIVAAAENELKKLIDKYQPTLPESVFDFAIRTGKVYKEVVNEAVESNAFLIVTGTHGVSGFEERWMGSNANKIVSDSPCPVITIRGGVPISRDLNCIVLPMDSTPETRQKVPLTTVIAKMFNAEVHVFIMYSTRVAAVRRTIDSYAEQTIKYLLENKIKYKLETIEVKNPVTDLIDYAHKVDANLISIMTEMEKSAMNWWLGSYAQQLTNTSPYPVLVSHPKEYLSGVPGF